MENLDDIEVTVVPSEKALRELEIQDWFGQLNWPVEPGIGVSSVDLMSKGVTMVDLIKAAMLFSDQEQRTRALYGCRFCGAEDDDFVFGLAELMAGDVEAKVLRHIKPGGSIWFGGEQREETRFLTLLDSGRYDYGPMFQRSAVTGSYANPPMDIAYNWAWGALMPLNSLSLRWLSAEISKGLLDPSVSLSWWGITYGEQRCQ